MAEPDGHMDRGPGSDGSAIDKSLTSVTKETWQKQVRSLRVAHGEALATRLDQLCAEMLEASGAPALRRFLIAFDLARPRLRSDAAIESYFDAISALAVGNTAALTLFLKHQSDILPRLQGPALLAWTQAGLQLTLQDAAELEAHFTLQSRSARRLADQLSSDVGFADQEYRIKPFAAALWNAAPLMHAQPPEEDVTRGRRSAFQGPVMRFPETYPGVSGQEARRLYRAAAAHMMAHQIHGKGRFPVKKLKPMQIALVSILEDTRVEYLASREAPGLLRLWRSFHDAKHSKLYSAEALMRRLARALIDPDYEDPDPWVNKGRQMFFEAEARWDDPEMCRELGGLLGNDLGQLRLPFNPQTYLPYPTYRDDNSGLWDFGEQPEDPDQPPPEENTLIAPEPQQSDQSPPPAAMESIPGDLGIPVGSYPEWDHRTETERAQWTTVFEHWPTPAPEAAARELTLGHEDEEARLHKVIAQVKPGRARRLKHQRSGDQLDVDAAIAQVIDMRMGQLPDLKCFEKRVAMTRELASLVLFDMSESTRDRIAPDIPQSILATQRSAVALISNAMTQIGDRHALRAFCSDTRSEVRYYHIKDFEEPFDMAAQRRLAGIRGQLSTRLGAALRHAGTELAPQRAYRRVLMVLTDGLPSDIDVADEAYLVEDARKAVQGLSQQGIDVFGVGLGGHGRDKMRRIFGHRGFITIGNLEELPQRLPQLYLRLIS